MIAAGGFTAMAWKLACIRNESLFTVGRVYYASRETVQDSPPGCYPAHREYYRIIDEAQRGFEYMRHEWERGTWYL